MPPEVVYRGSSGERLELMQPPYYLEQSTLFDSAWSVGVSERPLTEGGRLVSRRRKCSERELKLHVYAAERGAFCEAMNRLALVTQRDVAVMRPGRLYIGSQFLECYVIASEKSLASEWELHAELTLRVLPEQPFWCQEDTFDLAIGQAEQGGSSYPDRYPRRYAACMGSMKIVNSLGWESPMRICIYGPCTDPRFTVGGKLMGLNVTLLEGEYAVIDQFKRTVEKVTRSGERSSIFDRRLKNGNTFSYAPAGVSLVSGAQSMRLTVTVVKQRSEPLWT